MRARTAGVVLELAAGSAERVADRDPDVVVGAVLTWLLTDGDLLTGDSDQELHAESVPALVMSVRLVDGHVAALDTRVDTLETSRPATDERIHRRTGVHIAKGDGYRHRHTPIGLQEARHGQVAAATGNQRRILVPSPGAVVRTTRPPCR